MSSIDKIKEEYPLHWMVWNNEYQELQQALKTEQYDIEKLDPRGRTPLMLAVRLCHLQSLKTLLSAKANANAECDGWTVVQEAVCSGDPAILTAVLEVRDLQRHIERTTHVPNLLQRLQDAPDFYVEMKWEFTSWVPLMSRLCPSDVYKVYKRGSNVRIDTTLLGFDQTTWQRGNRSYIFKGQNDAATMIEIDHDSQEVSIEHMKTVMADISGIPPPREAVNARLTAPVTSNTIDMDKISFERNKTGFFGWRSEKNENINGYDCKVFAASNVEFVTKTRTEHLNENQARIKNSRTPLQSFLGIAEEECVTPTEALLPRDRSPTPLLNNSEQGGEGSNKESPTDSSENVDRALTPEEYFSTIDLKGKDIGRPKRVNNKVQKFKANLWLSEEFPIKLQEQVLPILNLMSTMASPHVSKLKDFITMQLPAGFPVKIEIPLFHVLNACVTFGNVFALETPVEHVTQVKEENRLTCVIDDVCFDVPVHYIKKGSDYRRQMTLEDEDDLLQFAIQQSLIESGSENDQVDIWEALRAQRPLTPNTFNDEDAQLQRALHESLWLGFQNAQDDTATGVTRSDSNGFLTPNTIELDSDLAIAIRLSQQEQTERQLELQREQEMLEQVLRLSLEEK